MDSIFKLESGAVYLIELGKEWPSEAAKNTREYLSKVAPECRFVVLEGGVRLARTVESGE